MGTKKHLETAFQGVKKAYPDHIEFGKYANAHKPTYVRVYAPLCARCRVGKLHGKSTLAVKQACNYGIMQSWAALFRDQRVAYSVCTGDDWEHTPVGTAIWRRQEHAFPHP